MIYFHVICLAPVTCSDMYSCPHKTVSMFLFLQSDGDCTTEGLVTILKIVKSGIIVGFIKSSSQFQGQLLGNSTQNYFTRMHIQHGCERLSCPSQVSDGEIALDWNVEKRWSYILLTPFTFSLSKIKMFLTKIIFSCLKKLSIFQMQGSNVIFVLSKISLSSKCLMLCFHVIV